MSLTKQLSKTDVKLDEIDTQTGSLIDSLKSTPESIKSFREAFISSEITPRLKYSCKDKFSPQNLEDALSKLSEIQIPEGSVVSKTLFGKKEDLERKIRMIQARGDSERVRELSQELYGSPSKDLVQYAEQLVRRNVEKDDGWGEELLSTQAVMQRLNEELEKYGLNSRWSVDMTTSAQVSVDANGNDANGGIVKVPENRMFSDNEARKLALHEVGVHVLRAENGLNQPLSMFGKGLPNYLATEEGLAMYMQEEFDLMPPSSYKKISINTIVSDSVGKNHTFKECYERLKDLGIEGEGFLFDRTMRGYRGGDGTYGSFTNGHLYLQGLQEVNEYVQNGGDIEDLFVGKIGVDDLGLIGQMRKERFDINSPQYLPRNQ